VATRNDIVREQLTELKQDLHDLWTALSTDPKKQARKERAWSLLAGVLSAARSGEPLAPGVAAAYAAQSVALAALEAALGPDHLEVAVVLNNLGAIADRRGAHMEAEDAYRRSLVIKEARLGPDHPDVAVTRNNLGALCAACGRCTEAVEHLGRALAVFERTLEPTHPTLAVCRESHATVLKIAGSGRANRQPGVGRDARPCLRPPVLPARDGPGSAADRERTSKSGRLGVSGVTVSRYARIPACGTVLSRPWRVRCPRGHAGGLDAPRRWS
jgi:tetratricopeptide (TPR) repeat protein